ncbi:MAG TPA: tetratricopeptide repeat protein, partial [Planctomycetota bacterium]|nr:tetratricopeptide repeat protein [Planctomycetota bacterium]
MRKPVDCRKGVYVMRRGLALLCAAAVLAGCRGAQEDGLEEFVPAAQGRHFRPGMWDVAAGGSASLHRIENQQVDRATTAEASPQIGYFLTDRLEVLVAASVGFQDVRYEETDAPLALKRVKQADYAGALGYLDQAIEHEPRSSDLRIEHGLTQSKLGKVVSAIEDFRAALRIDPDQPRVHLLIGNAFMRIGNCPAAGRAFESYVVGQGL